MKQKKLWILVLAFVLLLSAGLAGCGTKEAKKYRVTFAGEDITIQAQEVEEGKTATKPADPTREGYLFDNWYLGDTVYTFTEKVTEDITLTAKWTATYSVTFEGEGISIPAQQVVTGQTATKPADPTREGYTFGGWYLGGTLYTFTEAVTESIVLTAKWESEGFTGAGTQADPLMILSAAGMEKLAELAGSGQAVYAQLQADVTLPEGFAPIGSISAPFSGSFDGNGHVIDGLDSTASLAGGLFGWTRDAVITDFTIKGKVTGSNYAGGVVGSAADGTSISLISSEVTVDAGVSGGIIGAANGKVSVEYCTASGNVKGTTVGGIAGVLNTGSSVIECVSSGSVSGGTAGGIAGEKKSGSVIYRCYSHGDVTATLALGAVVGSAEVTAVQPSFNVLESYFNFDAVIAGKDSDGNALSVNYYGATSAWDIATDIAWNPAHWNTTGAIPVLEAQDVTVPETVTVTLSGAQVNGQSQIAVSYHTAFSAVPQAEAGKVFAGWYLDSWYEVPYDQSIPLTADTTLYAAFADTALYQRVWVGQNGSLDLTGGDYTLYGAQMTSDYSLINQTQILYVRSGVYYCASIDTDEGLLTWKTSADGTEWTETATYMADYSRFVGVWAYSTIYGDVLLKVCEELDDNGFIVLDWQDELWDGAHTRVTEDGDVVLYAGWYTEWFFNEEGVLSYDFGYEIQEYVVAESVYAGEWLSLNGEVIVIDDTAKTITLDGVSASYTANAGEQGAVLEFTLNGQEYYFRYDSSKACYVSAAGTEECIPYVYEAFVGSWTTGDLAHTYVIDSALKLTVDGVQTVMDPSIVNYELIYSYTLDGKSYQLKLFGEAFLELTEVGTSNVDYLFNDEMKEIFVGSYTDFINEYEIDSQYRITRRTINLAGSEETVQGGFELLNLGENGYLISFAFEMDGTLYLSTFIMLEPCKALEIVDYFGDDQQPLYGYDKTTVDQLLADFLLSEDVWSTGGQTPMTVTVTNSGTLSIDGKDVNYMLSFDYSLGVISLMFLDPANESDEVYVVYEACTALGTLYLTKMTAPAKDGVTVPEEDIVKDYTLIPTAEIAKFVGTWIYEADGGPEYVIYNADGTCQISTSVRQEDGTSKVELLSYNDIIFYSSINLLDPTMSMYYMGFRAGEHVPELGEMYVNVARFGQNINYVTIMAINYTRSDVYPFVGLFQGEDNTKLEISETAEITVNGEAASAVSYERQEDGSVLATFKLSAVIAPPGGVGHPEYSFRAVMTLGEDGAARIELTNLTLETTVNYTKFTVPMADIEGSWEHGDEVIKFEIQQVGAKSTLFVSVNATEAETISYEFDADGNLVYVFTVNSNEYRVVLVKDFFGSKTLRVTCTYTPKQDIPIPPPPPPLP